MERLFAQVESEQMVITKPEQLTIHHIRIGSLITLSWLGRDKEGQLTTHRTNAQVIPNPLFSDSPAAIAREYKIERSNITFYVEIPDSSIRALVGAECCDITGNLTVRSVYQLQSTLSP